MKTIHIYSNLSTKEEEYGETYMMFEYNTVRKRYITKMIQEVKWNPILWISLLFTVSTPTPTTTPQQHHLNNTTTTPPQTPP
jgi:hypothetical protein